MRISKPMTIASSGGTFGIAGGAGGWWIPNDAKRLIHPALQEVDPLNPNPNTLDLGEQPSTLKPEVSWTPGGRPALPEPGRPGAPGVVLAEARRASGAAAAPVTGRGEVLGGAKVGSGGGLSDCGSKTRGETALLGAVTAF